MANYITNDRGETVIAVGAPASRARVEVEYPVLIGEIDELYALGADYLEAERLIRGRGITSEYEIQAIMSHTIFGGS